MELMYILINSSYFSCASRLKTHLQFKDFIISNLMNIPVGKVLGFFFKFEMYHRIPKR